MGISRRTFLQLSGAAILAPAVTALQPAQSQDAALCRKLASDPLRPQYHLLPAHNWMNDPNGPMFFRDRYHMFHQYNSRGPVWGNMNWAHATSPDMIHWRHEPVALSPTPGSADQDGVFSGSAVLHHGTPAVIYTGVAPPRSGTDATLRDGVHTWRESQCLAVAKDDELRIWKKLPDPVIVAPPPGMQVTGFRDPCLWRESDRWMLALGSGIRGKGGMILLYTSSNLRNWKYLHPLVEGTPSNDSAAINPVDTGDMWECPDFFSLGNKHVLLISTMGKVRWKVGAYANLRFTPENEGVVDWGSYYAAKTMLDRDGNRILWGWIQETRPDSELIAAGWAGVMSLPRTLSLTNKNELQTEAAPPVRMLRGNHKELLNREQNLLTRIDEIQIHDIAAEIDLVLDTVGGEFTLRIFSDSGDFATISTTTQAGIRTLHVNSITGPLSEVGSPRLHLHMLLDGSVLELFANEAIAVTARVYQIPQGPLRLKLLGNTKLVSIDAWQMSPISKDRLTGSLCPSN